MTYHLYRTRTRKEWRWRLVGSNGRKLCHAGEGFTSEAAARANIDLVKGSAGAPLVVDESA
jgi:uncharacterized protein YegP (UPF0339 family)